MIKKSYPNNQCDKVFKNIAAYIWTKWKVEPENLWVKYPTFSIFRNKKNKKWFAIFMTIKKSQIGFSENETIPILNVKCEPEFCDFIKNTKGFAPAYHMSKKNWVTILLDGSCPESKVIEMLDQSYKLINE